MAGSLDIQREFVLDTGRNRSITATPTTDGESVVLAVEDPNEIAILQITMDEVDALIVGLQGLRA